ncbi:MAG: type IV secretory system conjugative DNA transfer family protein [Chloroflexota bacterium]
MSARSHPSAGRAGAQPPRGTRPPRPGLLPAIVRSALLVVIGLALLREPLQQLERTFGSTRPAAQATGVEPSSFAPLALPAPPGPELLAAALLSAALDDAWQPLVRAAALVGLLSIAAELLVAGCAMALQARTSAHHGRRGVYARVLLPREAGPGSGAARVGPDMELFSVLAAGLPTRGRLSGRAPWCALVIGAEPDQPAELGAFVAGSERQRGRALALVSHAIAGLAPGAVVEPAEDPLRARAAQAPVVMWREFGLALPPEYPLRLSAETPADTLGPLLAAVRPHAASYVELQIVVRPCAGALGWVLNRGWRGRGTALKLRLEQKEDYALAQDAAALETKLAGAPFEVTIRAVAVADNLDTGRAALDAVGNALAAYQARTASRLQRLVPIGHGRGAQSAVLGRVPRFTPPATLLLPLRPWRDPDILTPAELAGLWHLPAPSISGLVRLLDCRRIQAPPHAFIGPATGSDRVAVGYARHADGTDAPVGPSLRDLRQILHLTAGMGAGKSRLLANICVQFAPHGFTLIDGKGDDREGSLVTTVRRLTPLADEGRLVLLDVLDAAWPIGLNPLAGTDLAQPGGADLALGQVLAIFARLDPETWSKAPGMQQFATMATLLVLESEPQPTLAHVRQALLDHAYRTRLLEGASNVEVVSFWRTTFGQLGEGQRSSRDALLRRLDALLTSETTRYLATQAEPTFNLTDAIERGLIVLVPLPDMTLGGLAGAVGMLVFQAFVRAAFARGGSDTTRASYPLVVDELQVLAGGAAADLEVAMTRLRSLGIPAIYAHQALAQLGDLRDIMLINAANRIILQTSEPDASVYARAYAASGITAADISQQNPTQHQYAVLRCEGAPAGPFSMRPLPWPPPQEPEVPPYTGPDWRTVLPERPDPIDPLLTRLAYGPAAEGETVAALAALDQAEWEHVLARWNAIRGCQRQYILDHPGCVPDRFERQRWLSRLLAARPRLLAAAEYARARRS